MTDLFDGFEERSVTVGEDRLFVRMKGSGPPLLLLHGYPQTSAMWHRVAPTLAERYRVVMPDLPGYGRSDAPAEGPQRYTKRRMASDMVALMESLGHDRFALTGHDRGGRVAYRLALDHPDRVVALGILDIVPTGALWADFSVARALSFYHWLFLAQPAPLPESLIGHDPAAFLDLTMSRWTAAKDLSAFDPAAMDEYRTCFAEPRHLAASCDDYRAGATYDREDDEADMAKGNRIACPMLVLWGSAFAAGGGMSPLDVWRGWAESVSGHGLPVGHFVCEEAPEAVLEALGPFLASHAGA